MSATAVEASTAELVRFLRDPRSYPERTRAVAVIETHMAYVFLTDRSAWKLKKPVRRAFLDFSTVELRRRVCQAELRLNRRLAPDVYLGTVPVVRLQDGRLHIGVGDAGTDTVIDWLVHMRRLPRERMLDSVIRRGGPTSRELAAVGAVLGPFYRAARVHPVSPTMYLERLTRALDDDVRELELHGDQLPVERVRTIGRVLHACLLQHADRFRERAAHGRIREVHGDLRPEHICLTPPPVIIDCLEFRRDLRLLDPADELAFLTLECERLGAPDVGRTLLHSYQRACHDVVPPEIFEYHMAARALLRAKLALWHLQDGGAAAATKWTQVARAYLALAERHAPPS